jgi:hypothetical protein
MVRSSGSLRIAVSIVLITGDKKGRESLGFSWCGHTRKHAEGSGNAGQKRGGKAESFRLRSCISITDRANSQVSEPPIGPGVYGL